MTNISLQEALYRTAENSLFAAFNGTQITPDHTAEIQTRIKTGLARFGWTLNAPAEIGLNDDEEILIIKVLSDQDEAITELKWQAADGRYVTRIDEDGDGR